MCVIESEFYQNHANKTALYLENGNRTDNEIQM